MRIHPPFDREPLVEAELPHVGDLALARRILEEYEPFRGLTAAAAAAQQGFRSQMLGFLEEHPADAHLRSCLPGHLTASALLLDAAGERALLTLHRKLGRWLQLGGHCDGDANLPGVALRECREESGIEGLAVLPRPIDLDVHVITARPAKAGRPAEPAHLHLDTRFLVLAPPDAVPIVSAESTELRWVAPDELDGLDTDDSVRRLFRLAFARPDAGSLPTAR